MRRRVVCARIPEEDIELIKKICRARGEDLSDFVRRAIRMEFARLSFLSEEEKKALGLGEGL
ncbi:ribbon-helix-helix protein, CopG family [Candidatus Bathyarchaeota archaeon]|nr:ribbon-helix-helix protein, CopG family [Candidatus Bathyarchaeota archaeon]